MRSPFFVSVVFVLATVGCSKKSGSDGASSCDAAINKAVDTMMASRKRASESPVVQEMAGKLRGVLVERCTEDKWADSVVTCFANAADLLAIKECEKGLTPEQNQKRQSQIMKVMMAGRMGSGAGSGQPPRMTPSMMHGAGAGSASP